MLSVVTLVSATAVLDEALLAQAASLLPAVRKRDWLEDGVAADIFFEAPHVAAAGLRAALDGRAIDIFVQPVAGRRKTLLAADMDSTIIGQECIDELADCVGLKPQVAAITEQAMRGEIAFEPALRARVALLENLPVDMIGRIIADRITLTAGARALVQTMRAHGAYTVLLSGGFTLFTREVAARVGFDAHIGNRLAVADGRLTGHVEEPILGQAAKRDALLGFCDKLGLTPHAALAVGDGANDLDMLAQAGLGVAFRAKPAVAAAAQARVDHADLTALLYAQGYRRADFRL
jgi:phosphoserine phosphatase